MAKIVNLRMARKARARSLASEKADEARARHGATNASRKAARAESDRTERTLSGARIDRPGDEA